MRRVDVFFYGLFMDERILREKGFEPANVELASIDDMSLRIGQRFSCSHAWCPNLWSPDVAEDRRAGSALFRTGRPGV
jgi:hypothetical protein